MWRRSEQSCDGTHLVTQGVLVRFMHLRKLMAPPRNILFIIRMFVTMFNTAQHLPDMSISNTTALILEV